MKCYPLLLVLLLCQSCSKESSRHEVRVEPPVIDTSARSNPERYEDLLSSLDLYKNNFGKVFLHLYNKFMSTSVEGDIWSKVDRRLFELYYQQTNKTKKIIGIDHMVGDTHSFPVEKFINFIMSQSKVSLVYDKPCVASDKVNASASVSTHAIGANLCFSIFQIIKINKHSSDREILGIVAHEFMHLIGFRESEAILMQNSFLNNYRLALGKKDLAGSFYKKILNLSLLVSNSVREINYYKNEINAVSSREQDQFCTGLIRAKSSLSLILDTLESFERDDQAANFLLFQFYGRDKRQTIKLNNDYADLLQELETINKQNCVIKKDTIGQDIKDEIASLSLKASQLYEDVRSIFGSH